MPCSSHIVYDDLLKLCEWKSYTCNGTKQTVLKMAWNLHSPSAYLVVMLLVSPLTYSRIDESEGIYDIEEQLLKRLRGEQDKMMWDDTKEDGSRETNYTGNVSDVKRGKCTRQINSCRDIYQTYSVPLSQEYQLCTPTGQAFYAFCDFYDGYGYTFVSPNGLSVLKDLSQLYTDRSHAIVRHRQTDGLQKDVEIAPLSQFKYRYPLNFQLRKADGFTVPLNAEMKPYIYVRFLQESYSKSRTTQGYQAAGGDITFTKCDANPNSYLAFFANPFKLTANDYYRRCCMSSVVNAWITRATYTPSFRYLPAQYFMGFEMHMGGCGGYVSKDSFPVVSGAIVGFRFDV